MDYVVTTHLSLLTELFYDEELCGHQEAKTIWEQTKTDTLTYKFSAVHIVSKIFSSPKHRDPFGLHQ